MDRWDRRSHHHGRIGRTPQNTSRMWGWRLNPPTFAARPAALQVRALIRLLGSMLRVLFICSRNRLRSPTAEAVFGRWRGIEAASAGTAADAEVPLEPGLLAWADLVFLMERTHLRSLQRRFAGLLRDKECVVLDVPDEFDYMAPALVALLERKVAPFLIRRGAAPGDA
jgi:predicted protein tyrosine phosphatase